MSALLTRNRGPRTRALAAWVARPATTHSTHRHPREKTGTDELREAAGRRNRSAWRGLAFARRSRFVRRLDQHRSDLRQLGADASDTGRDAALDRDGWQGPTTRLELARPLGGGT